MTNKISCVFFSLLLLLGLAACSGDNSNDSPTEAKSKGLIPQSQLDALEKATGVSEVLEKAEEDRKRQMEAQGI